ncbi:MAG: hypothetical protein QM626_07050, partial [Microbacterium sp.]
SGDDSLLGGTQLIAPVTAPVTIAGNAISIIGDSTTSGATTTVVVPTTPALPTEPVTPSDPGDGSSGGDAGTTTIAAATTAAVAAVAATVLALTGGANGLAIGLLAALLLAAGALALRVGGRRDGAVLRV